MDDRTIPDDEQSYAYCAEGSRELCKGLTAQRQSRMLKSHQGLGFGHTASPTGESQAAADPVRLQTGHERMMLKVSPTRLLSGSDVCDTLIIEPGANPNEAKHGSSK